MIHRAEPSTEPRTTAAPRLLLWVASSLYGGVLVTGVYYSIIASAPWRQTLAFSGLLLVLLALEQWAQRHPTACVSRYAAIGLLVARMALLEAVGAVDSSSLSRALYPLVPFAAYFSLGRAGQLWPGVLLSERICRQAVLARSILVFQ